MIRLTFCFSLLALFSFSSAYAQDTYGNYTFAFTTPQGLSGSFEFSFQNLLPINGNSFLALSGNAFDFSNAEATTSLDVSGEYFLYDIYTDPSDSIDFVGLMSDAQYLRVTNDGKYAIVEPGTYTFSLAGLNTVHDGVASSLEILTDSSLTVTQTAEPDPGSSLFGTPMYAEQPLPIPQVPAATPEPSSLILLGSGLAGLASAGLRRKRSQR